MKKGSVIQKYKDEVFQIIDQIFEEEHERIMVAAEVIAEHLKKDRIIHVWGPGGHSNLAAMEIFFRAGGLMHVNAILNTDTMMNQGALKSMNVERLPGYGRIVIEDQGIGEGDLLIVVNAYGINAATIDAAITAKEKGARVIGISSHKHANDTPLNHVARHPSKLNLQDVVDYAVDCKLQVGDACIMIEGFPQKVGALSTFANAFVLNSIVIEAINMLVEDGFHPPVWMSGNADGGDAWNQQFMHRFRDKIRML